MQETEDRSLGQEDPLEKGMATHSCILAWRIPWTENPDGLQSIATVLRSFITKRRNLMGPELEGRLSLFIYLFLIRKQHGEKRGRNLWRMLFRY